LCQLFFTFRQGIVSIGKSEILRPGFTVPHQIGLGAKFLCLVPAPPCFRTMVVHRIAVRIALL